MKYLHTFNSFISLNEAVELDVTSPVQTWDVKQFYEAGSDAIIPFISRMSYKELVPIMEQLKELVKSTPHDPDPRHIRWRYADLYDTIWVHSFHLLALDQFLKTGKKLSIPRCPANDLPIFYQIRSAKWEKTGKRVASKEMPLWIKIDNSLVVDKFSAKPKGSPKGNPMNITILNGFDSTRGDAVDITPRNKVTAIMDSTSFIELYWKFTNEGFEWFSQFPWSFDNSYLIRLLSGQSRMWESFSLVNEAARVGRSPWKAVQKELSRMNWDTNGDWAEKPFGDEELLRITASGDEISYEVLDYNDRVTSSGSFDGEGLSAGELDSEVWNYVDDGGW